MRHLKIIPKLNFLTAFLLALVLATPLASITFADLTGELNGQCITAPPLPESNNRIVTVDSVKKLNRAVTSLEPNTTIEIQPGIYQLQDVIAITADNVTIRGALNDCSAVKLLGPGMENRQRNGLDNGFWINAKNTTIAHLTIGEVYFHTIQINNAANAPRIYNVRMYNSGQQFIKANPQKFGVGVDNGIVEYSVMEYTDGPPLTEHNDSGTGYTNGIDIHAGKNWRISNNRFSNFHTPDHVDHLWNAAVLAWNGAEGTVTENNTFIDVDRAIAYGLNQREHDHRGGVIRNNMIVMTPNLYSKYRASIADAPVVIWDSPDTKVLQNTILTSGNTPLAVEVRFEHNGIEVLDNISDAPVSSREGRYFTAKHNVVSAKPNWFMNPAVGNLNIRPEYTETVKKTLGTLKARME